MKLRLFGAALACLANVSHATSLGSIIFDWNSVKITEDGTDITNNINWTYQGDIAETEYVEGDTSGIPIKNTYVEDPNTDWSSSGNWEDGGVATNAKASWSPDEVSTSTEVNYTGRADTNISRIGEFTATGADYTFSIDYTLEAGVTPQNSELGGGFNALDANVYAEIFVQSTVPAGGSPRTFAYVYDSEAVAVNAPNEFDTITRSGTILVQYGDIGLSVDDPPPPLNHPLHFNQDESVTMFVTGLSSSRSYSSVSPPAVPVPPAFALFISGLGALLAFGRKKRSVLVNDVLITTNPAG